MPKGVEHMFKKGNYYALRVVRIPMMPKGVEHIRPHYHCAPEKRENSDDAERR